MLASNFPLQGSAGESERFTGLRPNMGYTRGAQLPSGMTIDGRPWTEATLLIFAYAYEQATKHRRPPASTTPLR
ncbi:MAG: hypothetical protein NTZ56_07735 [Acidobacteria bacterium]|nr:hypothetical protein [Acidobacteriota bacterium]